MKTNRMYIPWLSLYDSAPYYQADLMLASIKELVDNGLISKDARPRLARQFGWSNQPQVVTFNRLSYKDETTLLKRLQFVTGKPIAIYEKDWK